MTAKAQPDGERSAGQEARRHSPGWWDSPTGPSTASRQVPGSGLGWAPQCADANWTEDVLLHGFASVTLLPGGIFHFCKACRALLSLPIRASHRWGCTSLCRALRPVGDIWGSPRGSSAPRPLRRHRAGLGRGCRSCRAPRRRPRSPAIQGREEEHLLTQMPF